MEARAVMEMAYGERWKAEIAAMWRVLAGLAMKMVHNERGNSGVRRLLAGLSVGTLGHREPTGALVLFCLTGVLLLRFLVTPGQPATPLVRLLLRRVSLAALDVAVMRRRS